VSFPALDPDWPATLSRRILTELLRDEMGFSGVIVTDDLGMKAVADRYSIEDLAVGAIAAGADILLVREPIDRQMRAFEALVRAAERDDHLRDRIERSGTRVAAMKAACRVGAPAPAAMLPSLLGTPASRALAASFPTVDARSPVAASAVAES
jgi:beta-N-acetylhexosaminidase